MIANEIIWYQGEVYTSSVKKIFKSIVLSPSYLEWKERFTYIHGVFDTQRKIDIQKLENTFGVPLGSEQEELFKLVPILRRYLMVKGGI